MSSTLTLPIVVSACVKFNCWREKNKDRDMNQKRFASIILIVVIVIVVGAVGYLAFVKKSEPAAQESTPTPISLTAGWKTYTDMQYRFEFKYPKDLFSSTGGELDRNPRFTGESTRGSLTISVVSNESASEITNEILKDTAFESEEKVVVGQKEEVMLFYSDTEQGYEGTTHVAVVLAPLMDNINSLEFSFNNRNSETGVSSKNGLSQDKKLMQAILSTFKFTN